MIVYDILRNFCRYLFVTVRSHTAYRHLSVSKKSIVTGIIVQDRVNWFKLFCVYVLSY